MTTMILAANWSHIWMVTLLGFCMVLVLLVVLIYFLKLFGVIMKPGAKSAKAVDTPRLPEPQPVAAPAAGQDDEGTMAAIAMALHLYYHGVHDEEPTKITLKRTDRRYSPWNAKLYGMNNLIR